MKFQTTLLLGFLFLASQISATNVVMNDQEITGSVSLLTGTKMCKDNAGNIYFFGNDRKLYTVNLSSYSFDPPTTYSASCISTCLCLSGGYVEAADNSDLVYDNGHLYFISKVLVNPSPVTYAYKVANYYKVGSTWYCGVLNGSTQDGSGAISIDETGRLFYAGTNNLIYQFVWSGGWVATALTTPSPLVSGTTDLLAHNNHIFYVGTDNKLYNYYDAGSGWTPAILNSGAQTAAARTNFDEDEFGRIFYVGSDTKIHQFTPSWTEAAVNSTNTVFPYSSPKVQKYCGKIYYADNSSHTVSFAFYVSGSGWIPYNICANNSSTLTSHSYSNNSDILITDNGEVVYNSTAGSNPIHILSPRINWHRTIVGTDPIPDVDWFDAPNSSEPTLYKPLWPQNNQFYPRNSSGLGTITCQGDALGYNTITYSIEQEVGPPSLPNSIITPTNYTVTSPTSINATTGNFSSSPTIQAGLIEYTIYYKLNGQTRYTKLASRIVCGDAYIAGGQSNMQSAGLTPTEQASVNDDYGPGSNNIYGRYSRTFGHTFYFANSNWGVSQAGDVWEYTPAQLPIEGALMLPVMKMIEQNHNVPVCVINNAIGTTTIESHLLNTSNPFSFDLYNNSLNDQHIEGCLLRRVYKAGLENDIKGFIWYQGEQNVVSGYTAGYYKTKFKELYDGLAANIPSMSSSGSPNSSFKTYLVQIHSFSNVAVTTPTPNVTTEARQLSEDLRTISSPSLSYANITVIAANGARYPYCAAGIHFKPNGYADIAKRIYSAMKMGNYGVTYNVSNLSPNIVSATKDASSNTVFLTFNQPLDAGPTYEDSVLNAIYINNGASKSNGSISGSTFSFTVSTTSGLTSVSYLGNMPSAYSAKVTPGCSSVTNEPGWWSGCHIRNSNDNAALSFYNIPVTAIPPRLAAPHKSINDIGTGSVSIFPNPAGEYVIVSSPDPITEITIVDLHGQIVLSKKTTGEVEIQIPTTDLTNGVYNITIKSGSSVITKKLSILK